MTMSSAGGSTTLAEGVKSDGSEGRPSDNNNNLLKWKKTDATDETGNDPNGSSPPN